MIVVKLGEGCVCGGDNFETYSGVEIALRVS